jgi:hypothetical protein
MAKTPPAPATRALTAALPPNVPTIQIPLGASVVVDVDVNDMVVPYTVAIDGSVLMKALVDRREPASLPAGVHRMGWAFAHATKGWMHKLTITVSGKATVLESRSEANKDNDHSVGVAFLVVV